MQGHSGAQTYTRTGTEATSFVLFSISFPCVFLLCDTEMSVTLGSVFHFRAVAKGQIRKQEAWTECKMR